MYRLFIDEVGHDNLGASGSVTERHLSLMGVVLNGRGHKDLTERMDALKIEAFGTRDVVLHRREILDKTPPFDALNEAQIRERFDVSIMNLFDEAQYTALAVQIDKQAHIEKYKVWKAQPYHYCLACIMERYVMWLKDKSTFASIARGDVMAEWRGINPNRKLEASYKRLYAKGTGNVSAAEMQAHLTSGQIKIETKQANVAGLQLADLLASPTSRYLICQALGEKMKAPFGRGVMGILLAKKFRKGPNGRINGFGLKVLP